MSDSVDTNKSHSGSLDAVKWILSLSFVAGAVAINQLYAEEPLLYRVVAIVVLCIIAALCAAYTAKGSAFLSTLKEARIETRKVVWPTKQETTQTTLLVLGVVVIMSLLLWLLDMGLGYLISLFLG